MPSSTPTTTVPHRTSATRDRRLGMRESPPTRGVESCADEP
jgi:hypothetical protein